MNAREAAKKWHCDETIVGKWLRNGLVPNAVKETWRCGLRWNIPDDAPCPVSAYKPGVRADFMDTSDPVRFVKLNSIEKSIKWIARQLGVSTMEVRELYEQVLREGGDVFGGEEELEGSVC